MALPLLEAALIRSRSRCARRSTTSFSRVPPGPMAPGSSPPWPGSSAMMISRSVAAGGVSRMLGLARNLESFRAVALAGKALSAIELKASWVLPAVGKAGAGRTGGPGFSLFWAINSPSGSAADGTLEIADDDDDDVAAGGADADMVAAGFAAGFAGAASCSRSAIRVSSGSDSVVGYRSNTSRCR